MNDDDFAEGGPDFIGDLAREGGAAVAGGMTNDELAVSGPGVWADLAKGGAQVIPAGP